MLRSTEQTSSSRDFGWIQMSGELLPPGRRLLEFANDLIRKHMRMSASTFIPGAPLLEQVFTLFETKRITSVALTLTHTRRQRPSPQC